MLTRPIKKIKDIYDCYALTLQNIDKLRGLIAELNSQALIQQAYQRLLTQKKDKLQGLIQIAQMTVSVTTSVDKDTEISSYIANMRILNIEMAELSINLNAAKAQIKLVEKDFLVQKQELIDTAKILFPSMPLPDDCSAMCSMLRREILFLLRPLENWAPNPTRSAPKKRETKSTSSMNKTETNRPDSSNKTDAAPTAENQKERIAKNGEIKRHKTGASATKNLSADTPAIFHIQGQPTLFPNVSSLHGESNKNEETVTSNEVFETLPAFPVMDNVDDVLENMLDPQKKSFM